MWSYNRLEVVTDNKRVTHNFGVWRLHHAAGDWCRGYLLTGEKKKSVLCIAMDAIQEDFEYDSGVSSRSRRHLARNSPDSSNMYEIKHNVEQALKDARRKINDLRHEVDRK